MYWHGRGEGEVDNDKREKVEGLSKEDDERVASVLSYACRDDGVGRGVEKMWRKRFFDQSLIVPVPPLIPDVFAWIKHLIYLYMTTD